MMPGNPVDHGKIVPPRGGILHAVDAFGYSVAGFRRLWQETAARLEFLGAGATVLAFWASGAEVWHWLAAVGLFVLVLATEALNTAIEVLVDRVSPEWSDMARDAKDLGSLAVGLMLALAGGFVLSVLAGLV